MEKKEFLNKIKEFRDLKNEKKIFYFNPKSHR